MSTWAELIAEVQAQIDVDLTQAYAWLLDRARVMNAEAAWLLAEAPLIGVDGQVEYPLPDDLVRTEAVAVNGYPYARSTLSQLDVAKQVSSTQPIYADGVDATGSSLISIWPAPTTGADITLRYLRDVADDQNGSPPFPDDLHQPLAEGAIAVGLARMDERFDSAGYFDARFTDGVQRLRKRRNTHIGRGGTPIRIVTR
jgi:hypothetical protein